MAKAPRVRGQRARPEAKGPLGLAARRVRDLAEQVRDQQAITTYLEALQTRRDGLKLLAAKVQNLVEAARVLNLAGSAVTPALEFVPARQATAELRGRYHRDPQSVRRAQPASLKAPLEPFEGKLSQRWKEAAAPPPGAVALAELLVRFPQFTEARIQIRRLCERLIEEARTLPKGMDDLERVRTWQQEIQDRIETLEDDGMDADVQQFLRGSTTGVPLDELLDKPKVMEFLRTQDLLSSLTVIFRMKPR